MRPTAFPGDELRARREELGASIYEVSRKTRVPSQHIEAIESGQVHALPSSCYAVGFLKTYCQFLGLDSERFVDSYRACSRPSAMRFLRGPSDDELQAPAWLHGLMTWAVVTAVVLLGWIAYTIVVQPQPASPETRVQAGTIELPPAPPLDREPGN